VPRSVAMSIVGHETESIYRHYAIADEGMQREAAARLRCVGGSFSDRPIDPYQLIRSIVAIEAGAGHAALFDHSTESFCDGQPSAKCGLVEPLLPSTEAGTLVTAAAR